MAASAISGAACTTRMNGSSIPGFFWMKSRQTWEVTPRPALAAAWVVASTRSTSSPSLPMIGLWVAPMDGLRSTNAGSRRASWA